MGYLTVIVIHNDAMGAFENDPKGFGEAILDGVQKADRERQQVSVPFKCYCNYISVEPPRHADHHVLFLSSGNCVQVIGEYEKGWKQAVIISPEFAANCVKIAQRLLTWAKNSLKKDPDKKPA